MMNKSQVDIWRQGIESRLEELTVNGAKQNGELSHIKESVDEIKSMVKEQNGRVRKLEQQTSAIKAIGSSLAIVFSALIGWMFENKG
tara:strand:+ start:178 stop:438 length:261 start_codon:yes stop_codon:yes gene_type:complete